MSAKQFKPSPFFQTVSDEERKEMREKLQGKAITIQTKETMKLLRNLFKRWGTTDLAFTCIHDTLQMSVYNDEEMRGQMLLWKDLAKQGKLEVLEGNNYSHTIDGKEYYFLTITPIGNETILSPIGVATGFLVNGYVYGFRRKTNRDAVFQYVKKFCRKEENDE